MNTLSRKLYTKEMQTAIQATIWGARANLPHGLVACDIGSRFDLSGPDPLPSYLPAVIIGRGSVTGKPDIAERTWEGDYVFQIEYLCALGDSDDVESAVGPAIDQIAGLFMQDERFRFPAFDGIHQNGAFGPHGCDVTEIYPSALHIQEHGPEQDLDIGLGHGILRLTVHAISNFYSFAS